MMHCDQCQEKHPFGPGDITVRSMLYALNKHQLIDFIQLATLERDWKKYQQKHKVTSPGIPKSSRLVKNQDYLSIKK